MAEATPLRYRGYYYDRETGFYYLNSRYYDPKIGRFINADSYVSTGQGIVGYNMFAYCGNNPVNASDPMGDFWLWDLLDVHYAAESWTKLFFEPSWGGFGYAMLDTVGLLPIVPSSGYFRTATEVVDYSLDTAKGAKRGTHLIPNASDLKMSQTVLNHMNEIVKKGPNAGQLSRPYINSEGTTLLLKVLMESSDPVQDSILKSGLRWDVEGIFRGSAGTWELVVDTSTNTVVHFNFVTK